MHTRIRGERMLTELDFARLSKLPGRFSAPGLADLLACAELTGSRTVHADVVTMNSRVELIDASTGQHQTLTLCYPQDAKPAEGWISVLSPVGASLIGLKVGDVAHWQTPWGEPCAAEVLVIHFQPEAAGDYLT